MRPLGPWGGVERLAVAVSGGADSLCLAVLAWRWAAGAGAGCLGLIVDHGLRDGSAAEAVETAGRLAGIGMASRILRVEGLDRGPGLAARAREARYALLAQACREAGIVDLLVGHHAGDQAETSLMRQRAGSGPDGLAAMPLVLETHDLRLLRPLLPAAPERLRATLHACGMQWIEDPSNRDPVALRSRLRSELAASDVPTREALLRGTLQAGGDRMRRRRRLAAELAEGSMLRPEGFALLPAVLPAPGALAALIRTVAGAAHLPPAGAVEDLVARSRAATLWGTRLLPAGRLGPGWLLVREADAVQAPLPAGDGVLWDGRFRLRLNAAPLPAGAMIGAAPARQAGRARTVPAAVRAGMATLIDEGGDELALPAGAGFVFEPRLPAVVDALFAMSR
ncbi:tRNA lysidine(34) synthetase TilS [Lichenicoccus roseus]|uniref:tRNA(Ile)-lysidine synthase n=1 Tax=Lichenicoccus roseus TaxID=2683649 RepID=A0A5R9J0W2_9PROT|nr:tRNA lysidine(34) synthetase TilS [Lichenicoccus roseus]TLU71310.1 tRNA lysidine(34) synthetase TilS [Lichenicoccus roseus]